MSIKHLKRIEYSKQDKIDKEIHLHDRNDLTTKSNITDLWIKVLHKAVEDIVLFRLMKEEEKELTEEEKGYEKSAYGLLFDPKYKIPFDDYYVKVICKCGATKQQLISLVVAENYKCFNCSHKTSPKTTSFKFVQEQSLKELTLEDILAIWGIEDIEKFRKEIKYRIEKLIEMKRTTFVKRLTLKRKQIKDKTMIKEAKEFLEKESNRKCSPGNEDAHYKGKIESIDFAEDQNFNLHQHSILKYICRYKDKGGVEDLYKATWYIKRLIDLENRKDKE